MKPTVYVETSVIGYFASDFSRDLLTAAHQEFTRKWWRSSQDRFSFVTSVVVLDEAARGDKDLARRRLEIVKPLVMLPVSPEAIELSHQLLESAAIPQKEDQDALHLAIAATNGIEYLVTWNCKHLANASMRMRIENVCIEAGYDPPIICTPQQLEGPDEHV